MALEVTSWSGGLRFKVLATRYGVDGGRGKNGWGQAYVWWKYLLSVRGEVGLSIGNWFDDNLVRVWE